MSCYCAVLLTAHPGRDFNFTAGTKLRFEDVGTNQSYSSNEVIVPIIDDRISEPRENFICTLKGDTLNSVQTVSPSQVTIEIFDNDGEHMNATLKHVLLTHCMMQHLVM